jgi:hypothetical protein
MTYSDVPSVNLPFSSLDELKLQQELDRIGKTTLAESAEPEF